jgi:hypothetical protein
MSFYRFHRGGVDLYDEIMDSARFESGVSGGDCGVSAAFALKVRALGCGLGWG